MRPYSGIPAMSVKIYVDDALARLRQLPDSSVNCVITSPPYWGLRDYGVTGQLGLEATPEKHIAALVKVFLEVKRVLKPDGTLWVNYGDTYASSVNGRPAAEVVNDNPKIIRSTEEVNKMEQAEQAKADQQAMMQQALEGAKTLNEIAPGSLANMGGMQ